jgi:hypothetical protein
VAGNFTLDRVDKRNEYETAQNEHGYGEGSRRTWNIIQDQFFNIDPINLHNIVSNFKIILISTFKNNMYIQREMYSALLQAMPPLIKQMDQQEYIANAKFIEKMQEKKNQRKNKIQILLEE